VTRGCGRWHPVSKFSEIQLAALSPNFGALFSLPGAFGDTGSTQWLTNVQFKTTWVRSTALASGQAQTLTQATAGSHGGGISKSGHVRVPQCYEDFYSFLTIAWSDVYSSKYFWSTARLSVPNLQCHRDERPLRSERCHRPKSAG